MPAAVNSRRCPNLPLSRTITMSKSHLPGLVTISLLVLAAHHASANPTKSAYRNPIVQDTCPVMVEVGEGFGQALVTLQDSLEFYLKPNQPKMSVRLEDDNSLYKASVDHTMIKLFGCGVRETNCTLLNEGGSKSSNLLTVDRWNLVEIKYINGEVQVNINMANNVMGKNMIPMTKGPSKGTGGGDGHVTFVVPPNSSSYSAMLKISCDENGTPPSTVVVPPASTTPSTATTPAVSTSPMESKPFPGCPLYRVEADHPTPSNGETLPESLTFSVYPNHPALHMDVFNSHLYIKFRVNGPRAELLKCKMMMTDCSLEDEATDVHNILEPRKWTEVTLYQKENKFSLKVNNNQLLSSSLQSGDQKGLRVIISAPQDTTAEGSEHFVAMVNVQCVDTEQQIEHLSTTYSPTQRNLPINDSLVATTETIAKEASTGISQDVGIAIGVLVGVLLIIATAIVISSYRKRRMAALNEHSPLQNQHQQQD